MIVGPVAPAALLDDSNMSLPPLESRTSAGQVYMWAMLPTEPANVGDEDTDANVANVLADALGGGNEDIVSIDQMLSNFLGDPAFDTLMQPLSETLPQTAVAEVPIPHEILAMLMEMATHGPDAASFAV
jgi:hypothetical protein